MRFHYHYSCYFIPYIYLFFNIQVVFSGTYQFNTWQITDIKNAEQLNTISWEYYKKKKDSALFYAKKALKFATEQGNIEALFIANIQLAEMYRTNNKQLILAQKYLDAAKQELHNIPSPITRGRYYLHQGKLAYTKKNYVLARNQLSTGYHLKYEHDTAILLEICLYLSHVAKKEKKYNQAEDYLVKSLAFFSKTKNVTTKIKILNNLGTQKVRKQQYSEAKAYYEQSLQLAKTSKNIKGQSRAQLNIGNLFYYKGDWETAIVWYLKSAALKETIGDIKGITKIHNNIAAIYHRQKRYKESLQYYKKNELYYSSQQDSIKLAEVWMNSAIATIFLKEPQKALSILNNALTIFKKHNLPEKEQIAEYNIALAYSEIKKYKNALWYLEKAEKKALTLNKKRLLIFITNLYGVCYFELKKYTKAILYYQQSYDLSKELEALNEQKIALFGLYETEQTLKNFKQSLQWHEEYTKIKDSLFNTESNSRLLELQEQYEVKQKEQEIHNLQVANEKVSLENTIKTSQLKLSILGGVIGLLTMSMISVWFYYRNKTQKAMALRTQEKNKEQINQLLQQQEIHTLETVLKTQQQERKKIAKDIHDNLGSYLATLKYQHETTKLVTAHTEVTTQYDQMAQLISDAYSEVRSISHRMVTGAGFDFNLISAIQKILDRIAATNQISVQFQNLLNEIQLSQETELGLYKIIQELLSNILKHAQATIITLQINNDEDYITLMVEDDGVGFDVKLKHQGIGLANITDRVHQLKGQLDINSRIGQGTTTVVLIPILKTVEI